MAVLFDPNSPSFPLSRIGPGQGQSPFLAGYKFTPNPLVIPGANAETVAEMGIAKIVLVETAGLGGAGKMYPLARALVKLTNTSGQKITSANILLCDEEAGEAHFAPTTVTARDFPSGGIATGDTAILTFDVLGGLRDFVVLEVTTAAAATTGGFQIVEATISPTSGAGINLLGSSAQGVHGQPAPAQLLCVGYIDVSGNLQSFNGAQFGAYDGDTGFTIAQVVTNYTLGYNGKTWDRTRIASVFKPVSASSAGANAIWTPASGNKFRLMGFLLSFSGTTNAKFQDGSTDIAGLLYGVANTQVPSTNLGNGILSSIANNVLNLNLSTAVAVGGLVWGVEE